MNCKFCTKEEELMWAVPYVKGNLPIRQLDGKPHICLKNKQSENTGTATKLDPQTWMCGVHRIELKNKSCPKKSECGNGHFVRLSELRSNKK